MKKFELPFTEDDIKQLKVGDKILISGKIYCGRDAVLPKIVKLAEQNLLEENKINLNGSVIFHTAVSRAGIGPTSSNKFDIESNIPLLSKYGVKMHLGKGALSAYTMEQLKKYNSVYAVIPPVTALLESKITSRRIVAFPEEGMEAFYEVEITDMPVIIAIADGKSIYKINDK